MIPIIVGLMLIAAAMVVVTIIVITLIIPALWPTLPKSAAAKRDQAVQSLKALTHNHIEPLWRPPPPIPSESSVEWIGPGKGIKVADFTIRDPLVYVVTQRGQRGPVVPSAIDGTLPIAAGPPADMSYWPRFDQIAPAARHAYLSWLAGGRQTPPVDIGFGFLFMYGLEHRALHERQDIKLVFDEMLRLRRLNTGAAYNRSFDQYSASLLCFLAVRHVDVIAEKRLKPLVESLGSLQEEQLASVLAWASLRMAPVPRWLAFAIARESHYSQRSMVVTRVADEFRALFVKRYQEQFGDGMLVERAKRDRVYSYRPASAALPRQEEVGPNPLGLASQFKPLGTIWNQCVADLRRLSTVVGKEGKSTLTVAAWESMPGEIRARTDHPQSTEFCAVLERHANADGHMLMPAAALAPLAGVAAGADRFTLSQSRGLCETAGHIGYGIEPDARMTNKAYRSHDHLAAFMRITDEEPDARRYNAAACMLRFGLVVAAADGVIHDQEAVVVSADVERLFRLSDDERRRLEALRRVLMQDPPTTAGLKRTAEGLNADVRGAIGRLLIAVIAADGVVTRDEVKALHKCYDALGLSKELATSALSVLGLPGVGDEPVTVRLAGAPAAGEPMPSPASIPAATATTDPAPSPLSAASAPVLRLDRAAIQAIMKDTEAVAEMLARAMGEAVQPSDATGSTDGDGVAHGESTDAATLAIPSQPVGVSEASAPMARGTLEIDISSSVTVASSDPGLPSRYAALYQSLLTRGEWTRDEAEALARQHGHMLSGALDALNEWACERYGGQLFIDDGPRVAVERELLG